MIMVLVAVLEINMIVTVNICGSDDSCDCGCVADKYDIYSKYVWY